MKDEGLIPMQNSTTRGRLFSVWETSHEIHLFLLSFSSLLIGIKPEIPDYWDLLLQVQKLLVPPHHHHHDTGWREWTH